LAKRDAKEDPFAKESPALEAPTTPTVDELDKAMGESVKRVPKLLTTKAA
jgi:hypothetical protein